MKTTLADLNAYMFEAMDRITNDDLSEEELEQEIKRAETMTKVAHTILDTASLQYKAYAIAKEYGEAAQMPALLGVQDE